MTKDEFMSLEPGDSIEGGPLLEGLCDDVTYWNVHGVTRGGKHPEVEFDVFWMNMHIGTLKAKWFKGKVVAGELK